MDALESNYFTLDDQNGLTGIFSSFGAGVFSLTLHGKPLILEFEQEKDYLSSPGYHGKTLARIAGRIPDRFILNGTLYEVPGDDAHICLHGAETGSLSYRNFEAKEEEDETERRVIFHRLSPDGECGFPGNLELTVTYAFLKGKEHKLKITCEAISDKDTLFSFSNHMYWNTTGGDVNGYSLYVKSSKMGEFKPGCQLVCSVKDVEPCFDYRKPQRLKENLDLIAKEHPEIGTLDHTFLLDKGEGPDVILDTGSIVVEVETDFDSVNFYADNCLKPFRFKNNPALTYTSPRALAIEPEPFPLLSNLYLKAGEKFCHSMTYTIKEKE